MVRRSGRLHVIGWALAVVLAATTGATCLSAAQQTPAERACCDAMAHECGDMTLESACCATQPDSDYAVVAITTLPAALPVAVLEATTGFMAPAPRPLMRDASFARPPGVPTYLFVSSFRL